MQVFGHPSKREVHTAKRMNIELGGHVQTLVSRVGGSSLGYPISVHSGDVVFHPSANGRVLSTGLGVKGRVLGTQRQLFGHPSKREVHTIDHFGELCASKRQIPPSISAGCSNTCIKG
jgi:hypothetical protein